MPHLINHSSKSSQSSHTPGVTRGEESVQKEGVEPGRETGTRMARDATSVSPSSKAPIDPRMPHLPPA